MLVGQVARRRRQVVGGDGGQGEPAVAARLLGPAVLLLLEPQDGGAQDPAGGQVVAHPGLHGPQVLPDHDGAGAVGLQEHHADHRLVVVAHVGALVRAHALGDPPQAEQPDDVVHPQGARVAQHRAHHVPQGPVGAGGQVDGVPRRLRPVLAELVVHVRGRADLDAAGEGLRVAPHVGPAGVDAHREVVHDAQGHPRGLGLGLGAAELLVDDPLEPGEEVDPVGQDAGLVGHVGGAGVAQPGRPVLLGPVLLDQRAPQGEALQPLALLGAEALEVALTGPAAPGGEDDLQGLALGLPGGVAVDRLGGEVGVLDLLQGPLDQGAARPGQAGDLADGLGADVDGVDEAAGDRQVGRGGHGAGGLGRVQGVDEEEVGALIAQEADQLGQVVGVAHPPRAARAGGVELGHDAPAALAQRGGQVEVVGGDGQGGGDGAGRRRTAPAGPAGPLVPVDRADLGDELVPAQRQVGGDDEGRLPGAHAVDHAGPRPVLGLRQLALVPVLQLHAQAQRGAVGRVDDDGALDPAPHDDGGRQDAAPGGEPGLAQGVLDLHGRGGGHAQGPQDGDEGVARGRGEIAVEVPVLGGDAVGLGELPEALAGGLGCGTGVGHSGNGLVIRR